MDTYANMQSVGIEPPRLRGLDTDPAVAAAAARGAAGHGGPMAASLDLETPSSVFNGAGGGAGGLSGGSSAADEVQRGMDVRRSVSDSGRGAGSNAWRSSMPEGVGPSEEEDGSSSAWRSSQEMGRQGGGGGRDVQRSVEGAALLAAAGAAAGMPDVRRSVEAPGLLSIPSPGQGPASGGGGGVSALCAGWLCWLCWC
jgi:hypothetical protein